MKRCGAVATLSVTLWSASSAMSHSRSARPADPARAASTLTRPSPGTRARARCPAKDTGRNCARVRPGCGIVRSGSAMRTSSSSSRSRSMRRGPQRTTGCARPSSRFDALQRPQQLARREHGEQSRRGIDELRLILRTERRGSIQTRARDEPAAVEQPRAARTRLRSVAADRRDCCRARRTPASTPPRSRCGGRSAARGDGGGGAGRRRGGAAPRRLRSRRARRALRRRPLECRSTTAPAPDRLSPAAARSSRKS